MRISNKGQITIPQELRRRYGLEPGMEVDVVPGDAGPVVVRRGESRGDRLVAHLLDRSDVGLTADELLAQTRGDER